MARFLTLIGTDVPVATDKADVSDVEVGGRDRANDGTLALSRTAIKRAVDFSTSWLDPATAQGLLGLLRGRGDHWAFDPDSVGRVWYSGKGNGPNGTATMASYASTVIAEAVGTEYALPKFGTGCADASPATQNLFAQNARTGTDTLGNTTGFTANGGATLASQSLLAAWQGAKVLQVTTASFTAGSGFQAAQNVSASTQYSGSVYLRAQSGTPTVRVYLQETAGGSAVGSAKTVALNSTQWKRVQVALTTGSATTQIALVVDNPSGAATSFVFYADGLQLEQKSGYWTSWVDGTRNQVDALFTLGEHLASDDLTVMCWARASGSANVGNLLTIGTTTDNLRIYDGGGFLAVDWTANGSLVGTYSGSPVTWDGPFVHLAVVMRRSPPSGSSALEVYVAGAIDGTGTLSPAPNWGASPTLALGTDVNAANPGHFTIDDLVVLPYGLTAAQIAGVYGLGSAFPDLPCLKASGTSVEAAAGLEILMVGSDVKSASTLGRLNGFNYADVRKISAKLEQR